MIIARELYFNSSVSRWTAVMAGVAQVPVLGLVFLNIFIDDVDNEINNTLSKSADDMKLSAAVDATRGMDAAQGDLYKCEKKQALQWVGTIPDMSTD